MVFHGENHLGEPTMSAPYCTPKLLVIPIWNHSLGGYNHFHPYPNIPQRTRFVLLSNDGIRVWLKIRYIHQDPMDDHRFPHWNDFIVVNHQFSDAPIYHIKIYIYICTRIYIYIYIKLVISPFSIPMNTPCSFMSVSEENNNDAPLRKGIPRNPEFLLLDAKHLEMCNQRRRKVVG